ncbi:MAG: Oligopeptide transport ATP-binding protein OppD [Pseudomonadota bacterium]|jgi:oligopeptide/dipeptide ABC transporter ATP-binding protein
MDRTLEHAAAGARVDGADDAVLRVDDLTVQFRTDAGWITAVDGVSFSVGPSECLGVVGESGSGKSVSALSVLRLHAKATSRMPSGRILFGGRDLLRASAGEMRQLRGRDVAMIFQDPMSSLNPVLTIAEQIVEPLRLHQGLDRATARRRAIELLDLVRIPDAARRVDEHPHRLSGGMRQRVMIAIAIACRPKLLIADEPTTALDVTIQSQILELLRELQRELSMSVVLITHDMGVIAQFAQRVVVMYAGQVVESAPVEALFDAPMHPYTEGLLAAIPRIDGPVRRLASIPGSIPDPALRMAGCRFAPRCPQARDACHTTPPALAGAGAARLSRCPPRVAAAGGVR